MRITNSVNGAILKRNSPSIKNCTSIDHKIWNNQANYSPHSKKPTMQMFCTGGCMILRHVIQVIWCVTISHADMKSIVFKSTPPPLLLLAIKNIHAALNTVFDWSQFWINWEIWIYPLHRIICSNVLYCQHLLYIHMCMCHKDPTPR